MTETQQAGKGGMQERILAEGELQEGVIFRVIREEAGDYVTEYAEGERSSRQLHRTLGEAMFDFVEAVRDAETWALVFEVKEAAVKEAAKR